MATWIKIVLSISLVLPVTVWAWRHYLVKVR
jgi:hypothetical protein